MSAVLVRSLCIAAIAFAARPASAQAVLFEDGAVPSIRPESRDGFGRPVRIRGDRLFVGAPVADVGMPRTGNVQVFDVGPPTTFSTLLSAGDRWTGDGFGAALAIDGDVLVVGANSHAHGSAGAGAAYVFRWNGGAWIEEAELLASDRAQDDAFGTRVGVSGGTVVVTAPGRDAPGVIDQGALYVFDYVAGAWFESHRASAWDGIHGSRLGRISVAIDGDLLAADASDATTTYGDKAVYAFRRSGVTWAPERKFVVPPTSAPTFGDGLDVDGEAIAIGEPYGAEGRGIVWIHRKAGGAWSEEAQLHHQYGNGLDLLGYSLELQGDRLLAGTIGDFVWDDFSGAAVVFERTGSAWVETLRLVPSAGVDWDWLGSAVALDGDRAVVAGGHKSQIAYLYSLRPRVGASVCAGDGSAAACPCGNQSAPGRGFGCANGTGLGASLAACGSSSASADDVVLGALYMVGHTPVVLAVSPDVAAGGMGKPFGDGLMCLDGGRFRVGVQTTTPAGSGLAIFGPGLGAMGLWNAGDTRYFQAWYRDRHSTCGFRVNTTNALQVVFTP